MTSVDSGVETGNESNDSSIVQYESLSSNQISSVSFAVATTANDEKNERENGPVTFPFEIDPATFHSSISRLGPILEKFDDNRGIQSLPLTSSLRAVAIPKPKSLLKFKFPFTYTCSKIPRRKLLLSQYTTYGKMKSVWKSYNDHHSINQAGVISSLVERKMRLAAATNNTSMIRRLLSNGVLPNNHDEKGRTPLHIASCWGYTEIVQLLLEYGADPNQCDCEGNTPLHLATVTNRISVVTLLLKAGSDILSVDERGHNPLQLAQTKLKLFQNSKGEDMMKVKEELHDIVNMLLVYVQKQEHAHEKVHTFSNFYRRLSLSNTSDQVQDDVKHLLASLDALNLTG